MPNSVQAVNTVLVATPTVGFGDLIRHSLEETGLYRVHVVHSAVEARTFWADTCCQFVILDSDLSGSSLRDLVYDLQHSCPDMRLVLIPPENDPRHPAIEGIPTAAFLQKPFYLPDLVDLMQQLTTGTQPDAPSQVNPHAWISQPILDRLLSTTSSTAGAVAWQDGDFVQGGMLPKGTEAGLAAIMARFWQRDERSDLVRFARLEFNQGSFDCLVYMSALNADADLTAGLIYPIQTPLSKVRTQAAPILEALRELLTQSNDQQSAQATQPAPQEPSDPIPPPDLLEVSAGWIPDGPPGDPIVAATEDLASAPFTNPTAELPGQATAPSNAQEPILPDSDFWEDEGEIPAFNLAEMLGNIPSPDPNGKPAPQSGDYNGWLPETIFPPAPVNEPDIQPDGPPRWEPSLTVKPSVLPVPPKDESRLRWEREVLDAAANSPVQPASTPGPRGAFIRSEEIEHSNQPEPVQDEKAKEIDQDLSTPPLEVGPASPHSPPELDDLAIQPLDELDEEDGEASGEQGSVLTALTSLDQLEPATAGLSLLNYTCVLIPRLPQHYLTRELSEKISQWVQQLCLAFGWRLEGIALRPEYLQWTVQVAPNISPGNVVKIVRQRSSELIFGQFEPLRKQNPSGDFWATGYLIVSGSQPPSANLLREFIQQTRIRQGVTKIPGEAAPRLNP
jgi:REP element-mobilizing transposase RayT